MSLVWPARRTVGVLAAIALNIATLRPCSPPAQKEQNTAHHRTDQEDDHACQVDPGIVLHVPPLLIESIIADRLAVLRVVLEFVVLVVAVIEDSLHQPKGC